MISANTREQLAAGICTLVRVKSEIQEKITGLRTGGIETHESRAMNFDVEPSPRRFLRICTFFISSRQGYLLDRGVLCVYGEFEEAEIYRVRVICRGI